MVHERTDTKVAYDYVDKVKNKDGFLEKRFVLRESVLTVLFENPHVKTVHHLSAALFLGLFLTTIIRDFLENHELALGFRLVQQAFGKLPIALAAWVVYFFLTCLTYFSFKKWAYVRIQFAPTKVSWRKNWDALFIFILLAYYIFCFRLAVFIVTKFELPAASASIVLIEHTRMLMKVHAFIRSNIPKVLNFKEKSDQDLVLPTFKYFSFFIMVPTLVYKDEYPRTPKIRWNVAAIHLVEIFSVILFYSFTMEKFIIPLYGDFGLRKFTYIELFVTLLETSFVGVLYLLVTFYLVLHLVQNFFAEILRFGDRMFYKDWWTATDFVVWFRTWNVVVHDWLYTYIYKDFYEIIVPKNKAVAKYATFFISAIVHEWIVMHMFGFFFPVMFALYFLFSPILMVVKIKENAFVNILFWLGLQYGTGFLLSGYILEFYARSNGVPSVYPDYDFYIPRCVTCDCFV